MMFDKDGLFHISEAELVQVFSVAFARTLERDRVLFDETHPQERTFMHRFAQELRREFSFAEDYRHNGTPVLSLDVEYNRDGKEVKRPDGISDPSKHKWIAPDIILHERKSKEKGYQNDIFVCEMKKKWESDDVDAERLKKEFLCRRKYKYGIDFYQFAEKPYKFDLYQQGVTSPHSYRFDKVFVIEEDK